jgi:hypothetical protein
MSKSIISEPRSLVLQSPACPRPVTAKITPGPTSGSPALNRVTQARAFSAPGSTAFNGQWNKGNNKVNVSDDGQSLDCYNSLSSLADGLTGHRGSTATSIDGGLAHGQSGGRAVAEGAHSSAEAIGPDTKAYAESGGDAVAGADPGGSSEARASNGAVADAGSILGGKAVAVGDGPKSRASAVAAGNKTAVAVDSNGSHPTAIANRFTPGKIITAVGQ